METVIFDRLDRDLTHALQIDASQPGWRDRAQEVAARTAEKGS